MASPAKRRKKNGYHSSPAAGRSLEHFFAKQAGNTSKGVSGVPLNNQESNGEAETTTALTDEEIARRLQDEWNRGLLSNTPGSITSKDAQLDRTEEHGLPRGERNAFSGAAAQTMIGNHQRTETHDKPSKPNHGTELPSKHIPADGETARALDTHSSTHQTPVQDSLSLQSTASAEDTVTLNIPFDANPLTFQPSKYIPELQRHWASEGDDASYALLTRCFVLVNSTTSRIEIVDTLVNFLRLLVEADPDSLVPAVSYFLRYG